MAGFSDADRGHNGQAVRLAAAIQTARQCSGCGAYRKSPETVDTRCNWAGGGPCGQCPSGCTAPVELFGLERAGSASRSISRRKRGPAPHLYMTESREEVRSRGRGERLCAAATWLQVVEPRGAKAAEGDADSRRAHAANRQAICKCSPTKNQGVTASDRHRIDGSKVLQISVQYAPKYQECCALSTRRVDGDEHLSDGPAARPQRDRRQMGSVLVSVFQGL